MSVLRGKNSKGMSMSNVVALIPLRGGSKGIPDKNIRLMAGKPLCAWALEAACRSGAFARVVVSTDSQKIAAVVRGLQLPVEILERPADLATDEASTESVLLHAAQQLDFEVLVTIQATSPLVKPEDFQKAYNLFEKEGYDSLLTAVRTKRFFWNDEGIALNYNPQQRPRRQDFAGTLMENGAFYFTKRNILVENRCRLGGRLGIYEMTAENAIEIDDPADWLLVERALRERSMTSLSSPLSKIKLLVVDVDGTLTDGGMYWSAEGDQLKKFNTRDAKGLELVRREGVEVAIMTTENSPIVLARAAKLGIAHCFVGIENKRDCLEEHVCKSGLTMDAVAYIGDDVNDLECLRVAGFSACPADAVEDVSGVVHFVSKYVGGRGAVREICEMICAGRTEVNKR